MRQFKSYLGATVIAALAYGLLGVAGVSAGLVPASGFGGVAAGSPAVSDLEISWAGGAARVRGVGWESTCPPGAWCVWEDPLYHFQIFLAENKEILASVEVSLIWNDSGKRRAVKTLDLEKDGDYKTGRFSIPLIALENASVRFKVLNHVGDEQPGFTKTISGVALAELNKIQ